MLKVDFKGLDEATALLERVAVQDRTSLFETIGEYLLVSTRGRFRTSTGPDGTAWAAKQRSTIAAQEARGDTPSAKPLIGPSRRLGNEIHYRATAQGVEIGSVLEYAAVQQFGAGRGQFGQTRRGAGVPWGDIPARPFLGLSPADRAVSGEVVAAYLADPPR